MGGDGLGERAGDHELAREVIMPEATGHAADLRIGVHRAARDRLVAGAGQLVARILRVRGPAA